MTQNLQCAATQHQEPEKKRQSGTVRADVDGYCEDKNKRSYLGSHARENEKQAVVLRPDLLYKSDLNEKPNELKDPAEQRDDQHHHPMKVRWHGAGHCDSRHSHLVNRRRAVDNTRSWSRSQYSRINLHWRSSSARSGWRDGDAWGDLGHPHPPGHAVAAPPVLPHHPAVG